MQYKTDKLKTEFKNNRQMFWPFKYWLEAIDLAYHQTFKKQLLITCLGRSNDPGAHGQDDKLVAAADVRSRTMDFEELKWFGNLQASEVFKPYFDIIIEDERWNKKYSGKPPHIHFELNPKWWFFF